MLSTVSDAQMDVEDVWLTAREAGEYARVAEKTLANWRYLGIGPPFKKLSPGPGGRIRYGRQGLIDWLNGNAATEAA